MTAAIDWDELERTLSRHAKTFLSALFPPASRAEVDALRAMGVHPAICESYARHDGARRRGGLMAGVPLHPLFPWARITRWQRVTEALSENARIAHRISLAPGWLVIARLRRYQPRDEFEECSGDLVLVAADGELLALVEMPGESSPLHPVSLGRTWVDALGLVSRSLLSGEFVGVYRDGIERLEPPRVKRSTPRAPTASPGQSLLELLVEQGALVLPVPPDAALVADLDKALRRRDRRAAARDITARLRASSQVAKLALTEELLAALLEMF